MGQIILQGSITAGPPQGGGSFPLAQFQDAIQFRGGPKSFQASTSAVQRTVNSPSSFAELPDIGTGGNVTQADFLYLVADGPIDVQLTTQDSAVNVVSCSGGPLMVSAAPGKLIVGVAIKGSATIDYFASGQA